MEHFPLQFSIIECKDYSHEVAFEVEKLATILPQEGFYTEVLF